MSNQASDSPHVQRSSQGAQRLCGITSCLRTSIPLVHNSDFDDLLEQLDQIQFHSPSGSAEKISQTSIAAGSQDAEQEARLASFVRQWAEGFDRPERRLNCAESHTQIGSNQERRRRLVDGEAAAAGTMLQAYGTQT